ncbi:hypothetical protein AJ79_03655 [Helicocarpus griseus UAMH5409]|uniref:Uncharacterized protein n=1 Tax=Helicocarpus griseus UAMH5409 TaxID=1447875 RepID=A0A2B7XW08_9EURO|nr:hypothetical protein AJ79_03655 [Helicocarpus griseus UAMH5409]
MGEELGKMSVIDLVVSPEHKHKWRAETVRETNNHKFAKAISKWRNHWRQRSLLTQPSSCSDADSRRSLQRSDRTGSTLVSHRDTPVDVLESYAVMIKEAILRNPEKKHLIEGIIGDIRDSNECPRSRKSYAEEASLNGMLQNPTFEPLRRSQKGRLARTKEWLVNDRNPSCRSYNSSSLSPSSLSRSPLSSDSPFTEHSETIVSELPSSVPAELADTSPVKEKQAPSRQVSASSPASVPFPPSPSGDARSNHTSSESWAHSPKVSAEELQCTSFPLASECNYAVGKGLPLGRVSQLRIDNSAKTAEPEVFRESTSLVGRLNELKITTESPVSAFPSRSPHKESFGEKQLQDSDSDDDTSRRGATDSGSYRKAADHQRYNGGETHQGNETCDTSKFPFDSVPRNGNDGQRGLNESADNSDGEESDDNNNRKRKRFKTPQPGENKKKFACPYYKYDPQTYHGNRHRRFLVCSGTGYDFMSNLCRHLARNHNEYVCGNCYRTFGSKELQSDHTLSCTVKLQYSQEEKWESLWRERFTGVPVPKSPYWEPNLRLNTSIDGLSGQSTDTSGSLNTNNSSPSNLSSANTFQHPGSQTQTIDNPHSSPGVPTREMMLSLSIELQQLRNRTEMLENRVLFLEQTLMRTLVSGNAVNNNAMAYSPLSYHSSSNSSPNGAGPKQVYDHGIFDDPGGATVPNFGQMNAVQFTPSGTPTKEGATSTMLQPPPVNTNRSFRHNAPALRLEVPSAMPNPMTGSNHAMAFKHTAGLEQTTELTQRTGPGQTSVSDHIAASNQMTPSDQMSGLEMFHLPEIGEMGPNIDFPWSEYSDPMNLP